MNNAYLIELLDKYLKGRTSKEESDLLLCYFDLFHSEFLPLDLMDVVEKKHWRKFTLWERGTRTPFIIRIPNSFSNGKSVNAPVSLQDIYLTLVEICKLKTKQNLDGNSLVPLLSNPNQPWDKPAIMTHGPGNFAVRLDNWRYIKYQNGDQELYDISKDPKEFHNLADKPNYKSVIQRLKVHIPTSFVKLYDPLFGQFQNLDTMKVFIR